MSGAPFGRLGTERITSALSVEVALITTCSQETIEEGLPQRLFNSSVHPNLLVICVFQDCNQDAVDDLCDTYRHVVPIILGYRVALSAARNLAIRAASQHLPNEVILGFPDDDACVDFAGIDVVRTHFSRHTGLLAGKIRPVDRECERENSPAFVRLSPMAAFRVVNSNAMFVKLRDALAIGLFDEEFGVGARYGSGEDVDFALRAIKQGIEAIHTSAVVMRHPEKGIQLQRYFRGSCVLLAKWCRADFPTLRWSLARRLMHGVVYVARRQLSARQLTLSGTQALLVLVRRHQASGPRQ